MTATTSPLKTTCLRLQYKTLEQHKHLPLEVMYELSQAQTEVLMAFFVGGACRILTQVLLEALHLSISLGSPSVQCQRCH